MVFGDGRKDRRVITINEEVRYDLGRFDDFSEKATESSTNYLISQFPGPNIRVPVGATIEISVLNELPNESITIHWHGIHQVS